MLNTPMTVIGNSFCIYMKNSYIDASTNNVPSIIEEKAVQVFRFKIGSCSTGESNQIINDYGRSVV